jgi:vancomycin resistance protein YoaR
MWTRKISYLAAGVLLGWPLCAVPAHAQATAQQPSVAAAARKAREEAKNRQAPKVITNDDLANIKGDVSVVGAPLPAPAPEAAPGEAAPAAKPAEKGEAYWRDQFAQARKKLADDTKELDILQREYNLKEMQFYTNPNVALREQNSRADLNKTLDDINAKKADVDKDQQAISTLEDQLRQAGGDPGWSRPANP